MKKLFSIMAIAAIMAVGFTAKASNAQTALPFQTQQIVASVEPGASIQDVADDADIPFTQVLKTYFIQGGPGFMGIVLVCLILGLAIAIERILF